MRTCPSSRFTYSINKENCTRGIVLEDPRGISFRILRESPADRRFASGIAGVFQRESLGFVAKCRKFLARLVDCRAADDRGLSMHIVSDYANARAFVLPGPTPRTRAGVASLTAILFVRARLHRKFRAMRRFARSKCFRSRFDL